MKKEPGFFNSLYFICQTLLDLIYIHFLWVGFTILGIGLFGLIPASTAACSVLKKRIVDKNEESIFPLYWKAYKNLFIRGNLFGLFLYAISCFLWIDFKVLDMVDERIRLTLKIGFYLIIFFSQIFIMYGIPFLSITKKSWRETIKDCILIGLTHPFQTLMMLVLTIIIYYLYLAIPIALPLLGAIPFFLVYTFFSASVWKKTIFKSLNLQKELKQ